MKWRVGRKVPLNVYEGDKPMFQCHTPEDAARVVGMLNALEKAVEALKLAEEQRIRMDRAIRNRRSFRSSPVAKLEEKKP